MKKDYELKKCWIWRDTVTNFVKERIVGQSLNICAGANPICTVNIDLDPKDKSILKGDMRHIQFEPETFDTVVSDPPWKIGYYERMRPFFECVRVCKIGGRIIYNATWLPESEDVVLEESWLRQDVPFGNVSFIGVYRKLKANPDYEARIKAELEA